MDKKVLAIIPARGGSKGIPGKNIKEMVGKPLIAYSIRAALKSKLLDRVVVSTDDKKIAKISKKYGAEIPYIRPKELAQDETLILPVLKHMVEYLEEKEDYCPDAIILLQPTSPLRTAKHIDEAIKLFSADSGVDNLVSVVALPHNFQPKKLMKIQGKYLISYLEGEGVITLVRHGLPELFGRNGPAILICKTEIIKKGQGLYGKKILPYLMSKKESFDIDDMDDWQIAESIIKNLNI